MRLAQQGGGELLVEGGLKALSVVRCLRVAPASTATRFLRWSPRAEKGKTQKRLDFSADVQHGGWLGGTKMVENLGG